MRITKCHIQLQLGLSVPKIGQFVGLGLLLIGLIMLIVGVLVSKKHKWHNEWKTEDSAKVKVIEGDCVNGSKY